MGSEGVVLHYRFWYRGGYGLDTDTWGGNDWVVMKDYSQENWCDYTFSDPGNYYVVGHVVPAGENWAFGDCAGGFNVVVK